MNTVPRLSDWEVNLRPPVQGQSPPVQVKEPYIGNLNGYLYLLLILQKHLPRINVREGVWLYIEKESQIISQHLEMSPVNHRIQILRRWHIHDVTTLASF